jgi:hypothetical protein
MIDKPRIRMTDEYGKTPANVFTDFDWIHKHRQELLEQYGECSIIVYKERVIGVGETYEAALADAEQNLSPDATEEITPVHQILRHRNPFSRVNPRSAVK